MISIIRSALTLSLALVLTACSQDAAKPIDLAIHNVTLIDAVNPIRS